MFRRWKIFWCFSQMSSHIQYCQKICLPAVACSVFHIYTIYKLCNGEERYHSGVGRERGKMRWALRRHLCICGDDGNCCEVVIILLRKQSWIRNALNFFLNKFSFSETTRKRKRGEFFPPSISCVLQYAFFFQSLFHISNDRTALIPSYFTS